MSQDTLLKSARERMDKAIDHTKEMLRGIRTSRASSALVDNVRVDYYGTMTPLSQMAQVSVPEARVLVIKNANFCPLRTTTRKMWSFPTFSPSAIARGRE